MSRKQKSLSTSISLDKPIQFKRVYVGGGAIGVLSKQNNDYSSQRKGIKIRQDLSRATFVSQSR